MIEVKIVALGNLKEKFLKEAQKEYEKRLSTLCKLKIIELSEVKLDANSDALIQKALLKEAELIKKAVGDSFVIQMCIEGDKISSEKFSKFISNKALTGVSSIAFVIGSSHGLHDSIKDMGKGISVSDMTFPHQLFRVMLLEQIYRAFQISAGSKYHK